MVEISISLLALCVALNVADWLMNVPRSLVVGRVPGRRSVRLLTPWAGRYKGQSEMGLRGLAQADLSGDKCCALRALRFCWPPASRRTLMVRRRECAVSNPEASSFETRASALLRMRVRLVSELKALEAVQFLLDAPLEFLAR